MQHKSSYQKADNTNPAIRNHTIQTQLSESTQHKPSYQRPDNTPPALPFPFTSNAVRMSAAIFRLRLFQVEVLQDTSHNLLALLPGLVRLLCQKLPASGGGLTTAALTLTLDPWPAGCCHLCHVVLTLRLSPRYVPLCVRPLGLCLRV